MGDKDPFHSSTGMIYTYFLLQTLFGMFIFFVWSRTTEVFTYTGFDLFWKLFVTMFFSVIIARILAYILLFFLSKRAKGRPPSFYRLTFQKNINRISIIWVIAILLCCLIYAFGIDQYIIDYIFPIVDNSLWSMLFSYFFIKIGSHVISWVFLKTRNIG